MTRGGNLIPFLESQQLEGQPLSERLGGWLGKARGFRSRKIIAYHKNWIYFTDLFGLDVVDFVEPKPGIPPSPRHVHQIIETIQRDEIRVLLAARYFSAHQVNNIAERTGCRAIHVVLGPGGKGPADYFALVDLWVDELAKAFAS